MFRKHTLKKAIVASALCVSFALPAYAGPASGLARSYRVPALAPYITTLEYTLAPFAFVRFCRDNRQDCQPTKDKGLMALDQERRRELMQINAAVNRSIRPRYDNSATDVWSADVTSGDCEDYALTKRRELMRAGWPASSLRVAVARTRAGEGHAVLVVKTSQGDLVLDNRHNTIRRWNETDLAWEKIQSGENPRLWFEI